MARAVIITGATGNLGAKLCAHLEAVGGWDLRRLDCDTRGDERVHSAELGVWDQSWVRYFAGADAVVHLAADPRAHLDWPDLVGPNLDALINVFLAAAEAGVPRLVYASSNHVMGGYKDAGLGPGSLTTDLPVRPGTRYRGGGEDRDSSPYGSAKLFGERLGKGLAEAHGLSVLAVRIGWTLPGPNRAEERPTDRDPWFHQMWLSNRDFCRLMVCCLDAPLSLRFAVVNGMSRNPGMVWDLEHTRELIGYEPLDESDES